MDAVPRLLELPAEMVSRILERAGNFAAQRLVCRHLEAYASPLLLHGAVLAQRQLIATLQGALGRRLEDGGRLAPALVQSLLDDIEAVQRLEKELDGVETAVRDKAASMDALGTATLPEAQRRTLLKLCSLHSEFLAVAAVAGRTKDVGVRCGVLSTKGPAPEPLRDDPLRVGGPLRAGPPRRPRPDPFDPFAREPDPDALLPHYGDEDYPDMHPFPLMPGQPFPGGMGGVGGMPGRPPPGYNPDFERDRNPLGGPPGPRRGGAPPGPFNPGGFGNGGFGGPRFL